MITTAIRAPSAATTAQLHVVKGNTESLLSYATAKQLNLLSVLVKAVDEHKNFRFPWKLERPERIDIIEKVDGPTPWVSPIVVVPKKSGEVRICVALRQAHKAVKREKHQMATTNELISDFNDAIQSLANWISPLHTTSPNWRLKVVTSPHLAPCTLA